MKYVILLALFLTYVCADGKQYYSVSPEVGKGNGLKFSLMGEDKITAVKVWESPSGYSPYIFGFQFRYGYQWSQVIGQKTNYLQMIELFDDEAITQVSGYYSSYVQSLVFSTNKGRCLVAGSPKGRPFNMYAAHSTAELRFLTGTCKEYYGKKTGKGSGYGYTSGYYYGSYYYGGPYYGGYYGGAIISFTAHWGCIAPSSNSSQPLY